MNFTINIRDRYGRAKERAIADGYHAYHADGVTAIEVHNVDREVARKIAEKYGEVLYVFE